MFTKWVEDITLEIHAFAIEKNKSEVLGAWLALTIVNYHGNVWVSFPLNQ